MQAVFSSFQKASRTNTEAKGGEKLRRNHTSWHAGLLGLLGHILFQPHQIGFEQAHEHKKFVKEEKEIFNNIKKLSEVKLDQKVKDLVTRMLFNVDRQVDLQDEDAISTVTQNKMTRFYVDLNGELQQKGDNLWGMFSGVTKYTTHSLTKNDNTEAKLFGIYGNRERQIFNELVELV